MFSAIALPYCTVCELQPKNLRYVPPPLAQSSLVTDTGCPRPGNSSQCSKSQHKIKLLCYIQLLRYNMIQTT